LAFGARKYKASTATTVNPIAIEHGGPVKAMEDSGKQC
jgi:hypothetical protein